MTDTTILDGMMAALKRNPLDRERLGHLSKNDVQEGEKWGTERQFITTDEKPLWAKGEVVRPHEANENFSAVVDLFHQDLSEPRLERPRRGACPRIRREFDGTRWLEENVCGGTVHAVESIVNGAVRVDGKCLKCGAEVHRAGLLNQKG
jgi:hypothetical protein